MGFDFGVRVGFDSAVRWRSRAGSTGFEGVTRVARSSRLGSTGLWGWKLVEPTCERSERVVSKPSCASLGDWWSGLLFGCQVVSTQPFAGAHVLAQPASREGVLTCWLNRLRGKGCSRAGSTGFEGRRAHVPAQPVSRRLRGTLSRSTLSTPKMGSAE